MDDSTLKRLKRLLAMSQDASSEHEAMIAAKRLHSLLVKHNMSLTDLEEKDDEITSDSIDMRDRPWKRTVALYIAELYFCDFYYEPGYKQKSSFVFIGTDANRMFAIHIFKTIVKIVESQGHKECLLMTGKRTGSFYTSFLAGAQNRIIARCKELIEAARAGTLTDEEGNTLPVLASIYDTMNERISLWKQSQGLELVSITATTRSRDREGYSRGQKTGNKVQLTRTLQSKSSPKLLGG